MFGNCKIGLCLALEPEMETKASITDHHLLEGSRYQMFKRSISEKALERMSVGSSLVTGTLRRQSSGEEVGSRGTECSSNPSKLHRNASAAANMNNLASQSSSANLVASLTAEQDGEIRKAALNTLATGYKIFVAPVCYAPCSPTNGAIHFEDFFETSKGNIYALLKDQAKSDDILKAAFHAHVLLHIIHSSNQNQPPYRKHRETDHS
ncbi:Protein root UVB sensitive 6 [Camellia lanceoleosa]|uniref:Protein root UVB sensitive 6 n=1 Tax=Camellia lanceoleosa TaxID=1840588 RepID=A0ACC0GNZ3_9ERIC|nr:Protein root UVB sensitive 6 [Camellia lanceoleosa]